LVIINLSLLLFNLLPLYPLDGHHVVRELLPVHEQQRFMAFQMTYGQMCLIGMIAAPWILKNLLHQPALNPIGRYIGVVQNYVVPLLLTEKAEYLFLHAWEHYSWFLPW
jgi:Zn-dependent protease